MSNCINSGIDKIYVLTQFNSQSLNRHIARTYNLGGGVNSGNSFVEVNPFSVFLNFPLSHSRLDNYLHGVHRLKVCYGRYWQQLNHSANQETSGFRVRPTP